MKKNDRIAGIVESLTRGDVPPGANALERDPHYLGFFECFTAQRYFEAHEVLEHLWLAKKAESAGSDPCCRFFKGLIQVAGAYLHLQKHRARPNHPHDSRRLPPAVRLFRLAAENLAPYRPDYLGLDVKALHALCETRADEIVKSGYAVNVWRPETAPMLEISAVVRRE